MHDDEATAIQAGHDMIEHYADALAEKQCL